MKNTGRKQQSPSAKKEFLLFLSIPVGVIIIIAAVLQGPGLFAKPKYDFVYSLCQDYQCDGNYVVGADGKVAYEPDPNSYGNAQKPMLYYYSEPQHSSKQITLAAATDYTLDSSNVSPDGYTLWQDNGANSGGFLVWDGSDGTGIWYLKDGAKKKQLNLATDNYDSDVHFVGWVE